MNTRNRIDKVINKLTNAIQHSIKINIPVSKTKNNASLLILPESIKNKMKTRNEIRKIWQNTRLKEDKVTYLRLCSQIKAEITILKNKRMNDILLNINRNPKSFWNFTNKLKKKKNYHSSLD